MYVFIYIPVSYFQFCESPEWQTAKSTEISSFWTDWGDADCTNVDCNPVSSEAKCINKDT